MDGSRGLDCKEMINQKLQSGRLTVNSSLKSSREPDESRFTQGHFLIGKENDNFHLLLCEASFVIQLSEALEGEV